MLRLNLAPGTSSGWLINNFINCGVYILYKSL
jgi:hypothetical protein